MSVPKNEIILADCMDIMKDMPDKSVNLIISDPPYFEVKGEFDFIWDSFDDYLKDVDMWAKECKRILADNGSLFWYGHAKKIAYSQIILDKYFNLENNLVWFKPDCLPATKTNWKQSRAFAPVTERILFYSNEVEQTGLEYITEEYLKPLNPFSKYLKSEFKKAQISSKEIAKLFPSKTGGLTGCVSNWLNGNNVITEEQYLKIRNYLNNEYLRKEYEDLRRPFDNYLKLYDFFKFSQEGHKTGKIDHDTVKPELLTAALIQTTTKENDLVFIPFSGSGTEAIMCEKLKRGYIATEKDADYHRDSVNRLDELRAQGVLF